MLSSLLFLGLVSSCDFQGAYNKALEDEKSGSYGLNMSRHCAGASDKDREEFKHHYETTRSNAKKIQESGIKEPPRSAKDLNMMLENRELINQKVTAQTDEGAHNKKQDLLADRIRTLEEENMKLREQIQQLKDAAPVQK